MFSFSPKSFRPFSASQSSWLSETLVEENETGLYKDDTAPSLDDNPGTQLDRSLEKLNIVCLDESPEERRARIESQEKWDRWILFAYTCLVAVSVMSSVIAMATYAMGVLEIAFILPLLAGPTMIHQREGIIKCRKKREWIADMRNKIKRMNELNYSLEAQIDLMQKEIERLRVFETKLKMKVESQGEDLAVTRALYKESIKINETKKNLAEAMAFETLLQSILKSDPSGDHFIGDAELNLLAYRLESIEGVPFTAQELCTHFNRWSTRNLKTLVDVVRTLYVEKRREQVTTMATEQMQRNPTNLGAHHLWKRKIEYGGVSVSNHTNTCIQ